MSGPALRARAEFANYQKRAKQQADADRAYAVGSLARDLLDPIDNLERAIDALRASAAEGITAGLDMVQKQLLDILAKHGVEPIPAQGHPFDPNLHDAVLQQPSPIIPREPLSPSLEEATRSATGCCGPPRSRCRSNPRVDRTARGPTVDDEDPTLRGKLASGRPGPE